MEELPGGPVVRTWCFHYWAQLLSLVGDLRSPKQHNTREKNQRLGRHFWVGIKTSKISLLHKHRKHWQNIIKMNFFRTLEISQYEITMRNIYSRKAAKSCDVLTYPIPTPTYSPSLCGNLKSQQAHNHSTFKEPLSSHWKRQSMFEAPPKNPVLENWQYLTFLANP